MSDSGFWTNATEPKRKYRFTFNLGQVPYWAITKVDRPSFEITETSHTFYNHKFYYPGKLEWKQLKFSTVDPIQPDASAVLYKMAIASGYTIPSKQFGGDEPLYNSLNKVNSVDVLNPASITSYNGAGDIVEVWTLHNTFIKDISFGDYVYDDDSMLNMDVTLRFDYATLDSYGKTAAESVMDPMTGRQVPNEATAIDGPAR